MYGGKRIIAGLLRIPETPLLLEEGYGLRRVRAVGKRKGQVTLSLRDSLVSCLRRALDLSTLPEDWDTA
jgi:hypothetical protein